MFLSLRAEAEDALSAALSTHSLPTTDLGIEEPPEGVDAVLASNVAFRLASAAEQAPGEVAADLVEAIDLEGYT
ncbi:hypothetical protein, partial [Aeromonas jandaei]|uniref:hypothetical protein n=1 Tax=Aeromonas jandaei TaxID=650 RepID=UPI0038B664E8